MVSFYAAGERRAFQYFHATFIHWDPAKPGYINIDFGHHLVTIRGNRLDTLYRELILNRVFEVKALPHYAQDPAKAKDSFAEEIIIVPVEEAERPSPPADGDGEAADDADI